jgi:hypothetical protein
MTMQPASRFPLRRNPAAAQRFRLGSKSYALSACVCLYRFEAPEQGIAEYMVLTPDMRFAHLSRQRISVIDAPIDINHGLSALEMPALDARDFLLAHGEGDLVEDFPDLFSIVERAQVMTGTAPHAYSYSTTAH